MKHMIAVLMFVVAALFVPMVASASISGEEAFLLFRQEGNAEDYTPEPVTPKTAKEKPGKMKEEGGQEMTIGTKGRGPIAPRGPESPR
ncbi:MAG: hypothetical protein Q7R73_03125 [bacterium]|nr:hypothetical protein [bacterium]